MWELTTNDDGEDQDGINSLKAIELKDACCCCGLKVPGNKDASISRVTEHAKALEITALNDDDESDDDENDDNESDDDESLD